MNRSRPSAPAAGFRAPSRPRSLALLLFFLLPTAGAHASAKRVAAIAADTDVRVDGSLDEPCWASAPAADEFWQRSPLEGATPSQRTEFRVVYDDRNLYIGVRAHDSEPGAIRGLLTRRDEDSASDWITVGVDSYDDRRTAFVFAINPAGVQRDLLIFNDGEEDVSWDAVWRGAAQVDDGGWTAELAIPFSQLRFSPDVDSWGVQVVRNVARTGEQAVWSPWPKSSPRVVSLFGRLDGVAAPERTQRLELLPYGLGGALIRDPAPGDPFNDPLDGRLGIGLDAEYGLGSSFTLSGTINPDFGQVEADPSEVNLTASETFFAEKRPFFVEGAEIIRFGLGQGDGDGSVETLFYSRRIGAPPHASAAGVGDFHVEPDATTIYGAAKMTGKTSGGWSVGVMDALTGQETASIGHFDGTRDEMVIEPLTNYGVARVRKDYDGGKTVIGGALTTVHRRLSGTDMALHREAYAGGVDLSHRFAEDRWWLDVRLAGSHVRGSAAAIDRTQRASQRYYQRPDAEHLDYDPGRTSLSGAALLWSVGKDTGTWRGAVGADTRTPGFEVNDLGFQRGADYYTQWLWGQYRDDEAGSIFQTYMINLNSWAATDYAPQLQNVGGNVNAHATFRNYWGIGGGLGINTNRWQPNALRGGPSLRGEPSLNTWLNAWTDSRASVRGALSGWANVTPASDSWAMGVSPSLLVQAASNLDLSIGPTLMVNRDHTQYVTEIAGPEGEARYLLARLSQTTTALTLRINYTLTPGLSVQLYAQPFLSAGRFDEYKEPVAPRARDYQMRYRRYAPEAVMAAGDVLALDTDGDGTGDLSFDRPDFDFGQLRSNLVMRWEYRPGSTVFLIWSHDRSQLGPDGRFRFGPLADDLADATGEHVVMVKATYWLGI